MIRKAFSLVELMVVIAIMSVLMSMLLPAVQRVRESAQMTECLNNMRQVGLAFHGFHDARGMFPQYDVDDTNYYPFVVIIPYLEQTEAVMAYDRSVPQYLCKTRRGSVNVGPRIDFAAATHDDDSLELNSHLSILGPALSYYPGTNLARVSALDGCSSTILFSHKFFRKGHFPVDHFDYEQIDWGDHYFFESGHYTQQNNNFLRYAWELPCMDADIAFDPFQIFGSPHLGSIPSAFADNSVRKISYKISSIALWQNLHSFNDGKPVQIPE